VHPESEANSHAQRAKFGGTGTGNAHCGTV
jgi:hypothetical protein